MSVYCTATHHTTGSSEIWNGYTRTRRGFVVLLLMVIFGVSSFTERVEVSNEACRIDKPATSERTSTAKDDRSDLAVAD